MHFADACTPEDGFFVLHFESLVHSGRDFAFPCDSRGQVDLDAMDDRIRNNYLYARAMMGRELSRPQVRSMAFPGARTAIGRSTGSSA